jgi:ABC-type nickel/cobalt efflux system permease component RcnA
MNGGTGKPADPFADLITIPALGPWSLFLALLAAFGWGAIHAMSPGHGKTIVGAYLVGTRGTVRHAVLLGFTTTVTHTIGVLALGVAALAASEFILPEQLYPWLGVCSGLLVVAIGGNRLFAWWQSQNHHTHLHYAYSGHTHVGHIHTHHNHAEHHHPHDAHDHGDGHVHSHLPTGIDEAAVNWRTLLALGVSGGLLPCPSALVVMLGAIALGRIAFGLVLIVVFSLGLASVLTAIGVALVHASKLFARIPEQVQVTRWLPAGSALFITGAGLAITLQTLAATGLFSR